VNSNATVCLSYALPAIMRKIPWVWQAAYQDTDCRIVLHKRDS